MKQKQGLRRDETGAVMVEYLVAFLPVIFSFLATWQLLEVCAADLIIRRAASAAARGAAVVLPDDPSFYDQWHPQDVPGSDDEHFDFHPPPNTFVGRRKMDIEVAVAQILDASPHFSSDFSVKLQTATGPALSTDAPVDGTALQTIPPDAELITATVTARYDCFATGPWMAGLCGLFPEQLVATSSYAYQGAVYLYGY